MRSKRGFQKHRLVLIAILLVIVYVCWCLFRPLPAIKPSIETPVLKQPSSSELNWPKTGQASLGFMDSNYTESKGDQKTAPIASIAKVVTALVVLENKPLQLGEQGPVITLSAADEELYKKYKSNDGSVVPTTAGEQITQYQILQAMMLPSSNNLSDSLAIWAFGSMPNYTSAANNYLKRNGLSNTVVGGDASGLNPATKSTSQDLIKLGKLAMQNPVLSQIVGQSTATGIPLTTSVKNVNYLLGSNGVIGIKTGNSDEAGGAFLSASKISVNGKPVTIITAVEQADNLYGALQSSLGLIKSIQSSFEPVSIVKKGQVVGQYKIPWGGSAQAVATSDLTMDSYSKISPSVEVNLVAVNVGRKANSNVGNIEVNKSFQNNKKQVPAILNSEIPEPPLSWRLTHPL